MQMILFDRPDLILWQTYLIGTDLVFDKKQNQYYRCMSGMLAFNDQIVTKLCPDIFFGLLCVDA
ncbi:MAG: hypothetical protein EA359_02895 [Balneolaceae bacterium]|nr:MAG: hypothetical protein EA359_02895 [Balneolaceae bacterium]